MNLVAPGLLIPTAMSLHLEPSRRKNDCGRAGFHDVVHRKSLSNALGRQSASMQFAYAEGKVGCKHSDIIARLASRCPDRPTSTRSGRSARGGADAHGDLNWDCPTVPAGRRIRFCCYAGFVPTVYSTPTSSQMPSFVFSASISFRCSRLNCSRASFGSRLTKRRKPAFQTTSHHLSASSR